MIRDNNMEDEEPLKPFGQVLEWITYNPCQVRVFEEAWRFEDGGQLTRTEVSDALTRYAYMTSNSGRMVSRLVKTTQMQALSHLVKDFRRVRGEVIISGYDEASFLLALNVSAERAAASVGRLTRKRQMIGLKMQIWKARIQE